MLARHRPVSQVSTEVLAAAAKRTRQQIQLAEHPAPLRKVLSEIEAEIRRRG